MTVTATSASMICGNAMMTSIARISTSSRALREYAATSPTTTPTTMPMPVAMIAMIRMLRPPYRNRLSTSCPR